MSKFYQITGQAFEEDGSFFYSVIQTDDPTEENVQPLVYGETDSIEDAISQVHAELHSLRP